ncbi:MAG: hypothetical protein ACTSU0_04945 [Alphaproteobacteria bacterium]
MAENVTTNNSVIRMHDASVVEGATATLTRLEHGLSATFDTVEMTAGDAVTMWWVIFNNPANCSDGACGENDIFLMDDGGKFLTNADGSPPMNMAGIEAAVITAGRADGHVIDANGAGRFHSQLAIGDNTQSLFGPGLQDSMKAEVHLVLRSHGPAQAGSVDEMIYTYNGGCEGDFPNPPCVEFQAAVFKARSSSASLDLREHQPLRGRIGGV